MSLSELDNLRNSLLWRDPTTLVCRLLSADYRAATSKDVQVKRTRASWRLIHPKIAPDDCVMFVQRRGRKALCPRFRDCILIPQFFDSTEATFCDRHNPFDGAHELWLSNMGYRVRLSANIANRKAKCRS
jgi:hypothetical protein